MYSSTDSAHIDQQSSISAAMNIWEIFLRDQGRSEYTIKSFRGDMRLLSKFLPPDITLGDIHTSDLSQFIEWLENGRGKGIPCSPKSLSRRVTTVKSFFRWLSEHGRIGVDPAESILQHSVISPIPEILTVTEEKLVLSTAQSKLAGQNSDFRPNVLLKLLLETGIKKSECLNIQLAHIFTENESSYLFVRYADLKDRNKERKIDLPKEWMDAYQGYLAQYHPTDRVFPWSPRRLEYILEDIGKAAGIGKHLSFSMCRWNSALHDWNSGVDPDAIRQKLGISKIQWREIRLKIRELLKDYNTGS